LDEQERQTLADAQARQLRMEQAAQYWFA
jgi:hypothetical protein